jgi:hypothetical protein
VCCLHVWQLEYFYVLAHSRITDALGHWPRKRVQQPPRRHRLPELTRDARLAHSRASDKGFHSDETKYSVQKV